eukprot:COSAG02_NODE_7214_length_3115_cov_1.606432_3_plen_195_part_00
MRVPAAATHCERTHTRNSIHKYCRAPYTLFDRGTLRRRRAPVAMRGVAYCAAGRRGWRLFALVFSWRRARRWWLLFAASQLIRPVLPTATITQHVSGALERSSQCILARLLGDYSRALELQSGNVALTDQLAQHLPLQRLPPQAAPPRPARAARTAARPSRDAASPPASVKPRDCPSLTYACVYTASVPVRTSR